MAEENLLIKKILVAIDTSAHSRAALEAAAVLARLTEANIHGLFVQEEQWNKVSSLPEVQTINVLTGDRGAFDEETLEQHLRLVKHRLRQQLNSISRRNDIAHSWETARGRVVDKILEAAKEADLITIGRRGRSFPKRRKMGSSAKALISRAEKSILILQEGLRLGQTITVVYDGSEESRRGLHLGLSLAQKNEGELMVLAAAQNPEAANEQNREIEKMVGDAPVSVGVRLINQTDLPSFLHMMNRQHPGLLIIAKDQAWVQEAKLDMFFAYINCPVLLVR